MNTYIHILDSYRHMETTYITCKVYILNSLREISTIRVTSPSKVGQETPVTGVRIRITVTRVHKGPLACGQIALGCANAYRKDDIDEIIQKIIHHPPTKKHWTEKSSSSMCLKSKPVRKSPRLFAVFWGNVPGKQVGHLLISSHICLKEVHYVFERRGFRGFYGPCEFTNWG